MTREEIMGYLPHREPMLLIDSVEVDASGVAHGLFRVPADPFYCRGHFPGNPIVPGVILCEMMAQTSSALYADAFKTHFMVYRGMDQVKFRREVHPGDLCEISATLLEQRGALYVCDAAVSVGGQRCCQARITLAQGSPRGSVLRVGYSRGPFAFALNSLIHS